MKKNLIHFNYIFDLVEDLPRRAETLLKYICNDGDLPDDFELPNHPLFKDEKWTRFVTVASGISDNRMWLFGTFPNEENEATDLLRNFTRWIHKYLIDPEEAYFIGYVYPTTSRFPSIVYQEDSSIVHFNLEAIMTSDRPVMIDPETKFVSKMPPENVLMDILGDIIKRHDSDPLDQN